MFEEMSADVRAMEELSRAGALKVDPPTVSKEPEAFFGYQIVVQWVVLKLKAFTPKPFSKDHLVKKKDPLFTFNTWSFG